MADIVKELGVKTPVDNTQNNTQDIKPVDTNVKVQDNTNTKTEDFKQIPSEGPIAQKKPIEGEYVEETPENISGNTVENTTELENNEKWEEISPRGPINKDYKPSDFELYNNKLNEIEYQKKINTNKNLPTEQDFEDLYRTGAMWNNHPELQSDYHEKFSDQGLTPEYKEAYNKADDETQKLMEEAPNTLIGLKIYNRRVKEAEIKQRVNNASTLTQLSKGLYYGATSFDSFIPGWDIFKEAKLTAQGIKTISKLKQYGNVAFNTSAAVAFNEATFYTQGLDTNLFTSLAVGNTFALSLNGMLQSLTGRYGKNIKTKISEPLGGEDQLSVNHTDDGYIKTVDDNGIPKMVTPEKAGWIDVSKDKSGVYVNPENTMEIVNKDEVLNVKPNGKVDVKVAIINNNEDFSKNISYIKDENPSSTNTAETKTKVVKENIQEPKPESEKKKGTYTLNSDYKEKLTPAMKKRQKAYNEYFNEQVKLNEEKYSKQIQEWKDKKNKFYSDYKEKKSAYKLEYEKKKSAKNKEISKYEMKLKTYKQNIKNIESIYEKGINKVEKAAKGKITEGKQKTLDATKERLLKSKETNLAKLKEPIKPEPLEKRINMKKPDFNEPKPEKLKLVKKKLDLSKTIEVNPEDIRGNLVLQPVGRQEASYFEELTKGNIIGRLTTSDTTVVFSSLNDFFRGLSARIIKSNITQFDNIKGAPLSINKTASVKLNELDGILSNLHRDLEISWREFRKENPKNKLSYDEYIDKTIKDYHTLSNRQELEAAEWANLELPNRRLKEKEDGITGNDRITKEELENEYYENHPVELTKFGNKGLENIDTYYTKMLKEYQGLEMKGFKDISSNKLYMPRSWNIDEFANINRTQGVKMFEEALKGHPDNAKLSAEAIKRAAEDYYTKFYNLQRQRVGADKSYLIEANPLDKVGEDKVLKLDDSKLTQVLNNDFGSVVGLTHKNGAGKMAIKYAFGTSDMKKIRTLIEKEKANPDTPDITDIEVEAFERLLQDIAGTLRQPRGNGFSYTATRYLTKTATLAMGGSFGLLNIIETGSMLLWKRFDGAFGKGNLIKPVGNAFKEIYNKEELNGLQSMLMSINRYDAGLKANHSTKFSSDDINNFVKPKWLEKKLDGSVDKMMEFNLLKQSVVYQQEFIGKNAVYNLMGNKYDINTLSRMGLDENSAKELINDMNKNFDINDVNNMDISKLTTKNQDRLKMATLNIMDEIVIRTDGLYTPPEFKIFTPFRKLGYLFLTFPFTVYETLVKLGLKEHKWRLAAYTLVGIVGVMQKEYLKEQAELAFGVKDQSDTKYDYFNDPDALLNGIKKGLGYSAVGGILTNAYNTFASTFGKENVLTDYKSRTGFFELFGGASANVIENAISVLGDISSLNYDEKTAEKTKRLLPFNNLFYIDALLKYIVKSAYEN